MLKFIHLDTPIRINKKSASGVDADGFPIEVWLDIIDEDILCEWKNWKSKSGAEIYEANAIQAKEIALLRLWHIVGVDAACRITRIEDNAIFEILNVDDVNNRHQQLEIQIKRYVQG